MFLGHGRMTWCPQGGAGSQDTEVRVQALKSQMIMQVIKKIRTAREKEEYN
jgi:hypothetical protein